MGSHVDGHRVGPQRASSIWAQLSPKEERSWELRHTLSISIPRPIVNPPASLFLRGDGEGSNRLVDSSILGLEVICIEGLKNLTIFTKIG